MTPVLIHIQPFRKSAADRRDVYVGSAGSPAELGLDGKNWQPAIVTRPTLSLELMNPDLNGRVQVGTCRFSIDLNGLRDDMSQLVYSADIKWRGASVDVRFADDARFPTTPSFVGRIENTQMDLDSGILAITATVSTEFLEGNLLTEEFNGDNAAGGVPEVRGTLRPAGFGPCENIPPVWFDTNRWIGQIDGYGNTVSIDKLMEGLDDRGTPVDDYADYAALAAAIDNETIIPGRWGTCIAEGLVGLGAPPEYPITVNATFGFNRIGEIMSRILQTHLGLSAGDIDAAAFTALNAAVPYDVRHWTATQRDARSLLEAMAGSVNATPLIGFDGKITITRAVESGALATLDRSGNQIPRVTDWQTANARGLPWRIAARVARPASTIDTSDVLFEDEIIDRGLYDANTVYRIGNTVTVADQSEWLYTNATPGSGVAPPAWPTLSNSHWSNRKPPVDATTIGVEPGATVGAQTGVNLTDAADQVISDPDIQNTAVTIGSDGALAGAGGGQVTLPGIGYTGDTDATRNDGALADLDAVDLDNTSQTTGTLPTNRADPGLININVSIGADGTLAGGGGGQVTIGGLGYIGDLAATLGADWLTNTLNRPGNLAALTGSEGVNNSLISISADGTLTGGGGGQVTLAGLGFTGGAGDGAGITLEHVGPNGHTINDDGTWYRNAGGFNADGAVKSREIGRSGVIYFEYDFTDAVSQRTTFGFADASRTLDGTSRSTSDFVAYIYVNNNNDSIGFNFGPDGQIGGGGSASLLNAGATAGWVALDFDGVVATVIHNGTIVGKWSAPASLQGKDLQFYGWQDYEVTTPTAGNQAGPIRANLNGASNAFQDLVGEGQPSPYATSNTRLRSAGGNYSSGSNMRNGHQNEADLANYTIGPAIRGSYRASFKLTDTLYNRYMSLVPPGDIGNTDNRVRLPSGSTNPIITLNGVGASGPTIAVGDTVEIIYEGDEIYVAATNENGRTEGQRVQIGSGLTFQPRWNTRFSSATAPAWNFEEMDWGAFTDNAWATNIGVPANIFSLIGTEPIENTLVSIGADGTLAGGGGGQVTISGLGYIGDLNATRNTAFFSDLDILDLSDTLRTTAELPTSRAAAGLVNANVTMGSNGALSGAGGGQVTISGLGYVGDLDAERLSRLNITGGRLRRDAIDISLDYIDNNFVTLNGIQLTNDGGITNEGAVANSGVSIASDGTLSGGGGGQVTPTGMGLEDAADVTKNVVGTGEINFDFDNTGTIKAGQTGARDVFTLQTSGDVTITSGVSWAVEVVTGSWSGADPTISGTGPGQIDFGTSYATTSGRLRITATVNGRTYPHTVDITTTQDPPDTGGGSSGGGSSTVTTGNANGTFNTGWTTVYTGTVSTDAGVTQVALSASMHVLDPANSNPNANQTGNIQYQWQRETSVGSGTWTDVGSVANSSPDPGWALLEPPFAEPFFGVISNNVTDTGRTASTEYSYRLRARISSGALTSASVLNGPISLDGE